MSNLCSVKNNYWARYTKRHIVWEFPRAFTIQNANYYFYRAQHRSSNTAARQNYNPSTSQSLKTFAAAGLSHGTSDFLNFNSQPDSPFVASCFLGALPPVDLRAVCLVRAMLNIYFKMKCSCRFALLTCLGTPITSVSQLKIYFLQISSSCQESDTEHSQSLLFEVVPAPFQTLLNYIITFFKNILMYG